MEKLHRVWSNYKYRFVPWLIFNYKNRVRNIVKIEDKISLETSTLNCLIPLFYSLEKNESHFPSFNVDIHQRNCEKTTSIMGFCIKKSPSQIPGFGQGVVVSSGILKKGQVAALYPGTVYYPSEPLLLQSVGNKFILKCADGVHIDGNDRRISKMIYKSCVQRDRIGHQLPADTSWLSDFPLNPLAVGQYVNNHSKDFPANVTYEECHFPRTLPPEVMQLIPNITYSPPTDEFIKVVALIALRDIPKGEELFSSYFTIIHS